MLALHAAQGKCLAACRADDVKAHTRLILNGFQQIRRHACVEFFAIHHAHAGWRGAYVVLRHGCRHCHIGQCGSSLLSHRWHCQTQRQSQRRCAKQRFRGGDRGRLDVHRRRAPSASALIHKGHWQLAFKRLAPSPPIGLLVQKMDSSGADPDKK